MRAVARPDAEQIPYITGIIYLVIHYRCRHLVFPLLAAPSVQVNFTEVNDSSTSCDEEAYPRVIHHTPDNPSDAVHCRVPTCHRWGDVQYVAERTTHIQGGQEYRVSQSFDRNTYGRRNTSV